MEEVQQQQKQKQQQQQQPNDLPTKQDQQQVEQGQSNIRTKDKQLLKQNTEVGQNQQPQKLELNQNQQQTKKLQEKEEAQEKEQSEQTPFLLQQDSFKTNQKLEEFKRQKQMMETSYTEGKQQLIDKQYTEASKKLSKAVMAFEYIVKNHGQTISKTQIKQIMIQTILPSYNNLALCYIKLKNYQMVLAFTNQVLGQDPDNIKARYRRAIAFKETKQFDQAETDFLMVAKLDSSMGEECQKLIKQCKLLEIEEKKKRKKSAERFISGYEGEKRYEEETKTWDKIQKAEGESQKKEVEPTTNKQGGILSWVREKCSKCRNIFRKKEHVQ